MRFGEYEVERELARGGMGVVYVARHERLGRRVALKVLLETGGLSLERFRLEAVAVAKLDHPAVVRVHDIGVSDGRPFFAMELIDGEPLSARLDRDGAFDPRQAAVLVEAIARGVAHAHERGVLHRDLKPANVILTPEGRPLLTDFGLARELSDERERLTRTGELLGTPGYMPPEQADGDPGSIGPASDVYGLGATLYALLCGRPPFQAGSLPALLKQILDAPPEPPRTLRPELDPDLEAICLRALKKRPGDRYPNADAMADDLLAYLRGDAIARRPSRAPLAVGVLALAALMIAVALIGASGRAPPPPELAAAPPTDAPLPAPTPTTATPTPTPPAPNRLRRDWRGKASVGGKRGEWEGGFLRDGRALVARRGDRAAWLLEPTGTAREIPLPGTVRAFTAAGERGVAAIRGVVWQVFPRRRLLHALEPRWNNVQQLAATPDGATIAAAGRLGAEIRVVVLDDGPPRQGKLDDPRRVTSLMVGRDLLVGTGRFEVSSMGEGCLYKAPLTQFPKGSWALWRPRTGYPTGVAYARSGLLAAGSSGGQAYVFSDGLEKRPTPLKTQRGLLGFAHQGAVRGLVWSADARRLYTASGEFGKKTGELAVWSLEPGRPPLAREHRSVGRAVRRLRLSPDERRLLVLTDDGPELWSVPKP